MAKFTMNLSVTGGLAPQNEGSLSSSVTEFNLKVLGKEGQYAEGDVNPMRRIAYVSPGNNSYTTCTIGGTFISTNLNYSVTQVDPVNSAIYFMDTGTAMILGVLDSFSDTSIAVGTTFVDVRGASDMEIYTVNGTRKLFYAYKAPSGGDIGIADITAVTPTSYDKTWLSTTATGSTTLGALNEHKLQKSDNGLMYVLDGAAVHKIDGTTNGGTNGTFTANVLLFPATITSVDSIDYGGNIWIALHDSPVKPYSSNDTVISSNSLSSSLNNAPIYAGVFVWDRLSSVSSSKDFVQISGIKAIRKMFVTDNIPHCITLSSANRTQVRKLNGRSFDVVEETSFGALPMFRDSVGEVQNGIIWLGHDGKWMFYGKPTPSANYGLFSLGDLSKSTTVASGGAIAVVGRNVTSQASETIYFGYQDINGTDPNAGIWFPFATTNLSSANINCGNSGFRSLATKFPKLSKIDSVTLFYPPVAVSGTTENLDMNLYLNQSTTGWGTTTLTHDDAARGYKYVAVGEPGVNHLQLGLDWKTDVAISDAITPSSLEVEYSESTKKK